jgi:hypothetical protein
MKRSLRGRIKAALKSDAYFITITRRDGTKLYHYQVHSQDFLYDDFKRSFEEIYKLLEKEYPGMKYVS